MKKVHFFSLIVTMMLMSGCDNGYVAPNAYDQADTADQSVVIYDDMIQTTRYDDEITLIRCGDNYVTYGVNMYGIWFISDAQIILPDGYEQDNGTAVRLVADTKSTSGGISGKNVCYINEVKQKTLLGFDEEWTDGISVWGESYPAPEVGWERLCEYGFDEYDSISVVYKNAEDGGVYMIGNTTDELVVCRDGNEVGRYDQCRILTDPRGYGMKERIVLCDNDIDDRAIWQLAEDGFVQNDVFFVIGDIV